MVKSKEISANEMWTLLMCSLRYAMGRRSYVTTEISEMLFRHFDMLTEAQQLQVVKEILQELRMCQEAGRTLGDQMDHDMWSRTASDLYKRISK